MSKLFYNIILLCLTLSVPLFLFSLVNTSVSLQYETNDNGDCISQVTGQDLCFTINIILFMLATCCIGLILFAVFRKRLIKKQLS
jgi:hypothetical protein